MRYILDCDTGIDDSLALVSLLGLLGDDPNSDLLGVTASFGNVSMNRSLRNSLAVLHLFGAPTVPVYPGVTHARGARSFEVAPGVTFIHGRNGLGNQHIPDSPRQPEQMPASTFLARSADEYGKSLTIISTGAFTNLADALRKNPRMAGEVGRIVLMGTALTVPGTLNPWTEANVGEDPESARMVLQSGANLLVVGRDVTTTLLLTHHQTDGWAKVGSLRGRFLSAMLDWYIHSYEVNFPGLGGCFISDPTAIILALHPELITLSLNEHLTVETKGATRGRTIGDLSFGRDDDPRTRVVLRVDRRRFMKILLTAVRKEISPENQD